MATTHPPRRPSAQGPLLAPGPFRRLRRLRRRRHGTARARSARREIVKSARTGADWVVVGLVFVAPRQDLSFSTSLKTTTNRTRCELGRTTAPPQKKTKNKKGTKMSRWLLFYVHTLNIISKPKNPHSKQKLAARVMSRTSGKDIETPSASLGALHLEPSIVRSNRRPGLRGFVATTCVCLPWSW